MLRRGAIQSRRFVQVTLGEGRMKKICSGVVLMMLLSSTVVATEGDPVASIEVHVGKKPPGDGVVVARGETDEAGVISFSKLKAGTYFVRFWHSGLIYEIAKDGNGQKLTISKDAVRRAKNGESEPEGSENRFTLNYGEVAAVIVISGNTITVKIIEPI
jgi:hypothetical protein